MKYDLIIIGGGPAGYTAAFEAAGNGLKTCLIEKRDLGGTCLNRGCIPTKTLVHTADLYRTLKGDTPDLKCADTAVDYEGLNAKKENIILQLRGGIEKMLKAGKIDVVHAKATVKDAHTVRAGEELLETENILLCTGSEPAMIPISGIECEGVITSDDILRDLPQMEELVIIGGGVIGCEIAGIYEAFGTKVTVIEAMDILLPGMDSEAGRSLAMVFKKRGIDVHCKTKAVSISKDEKLTLAYEEKGETKTVSADHILIAAGRKAVTDVFECEAPSMERGRFTVNERFETSISHIYAAGDIVYGYPQLAHTAMAMAVNAVCAIRNVPFKRDLSVVPSGVYTCPEIASAGISEKEAAEKGMQAISGKANTLANARSLIAESERGFIKVTAEKETGKLLGTVMMCERATDLIQEAALAIERGMTVSELLQVIHGHPTFSEVFVSALEAAEKKI